MKMEINHGLSRADFKLYDYLKTQDDWVTQKDIALALPDVFCCTLADMEDFHNSTARMMITNSIRNLNESGMINKIILSSKKGVKIATEDEFTSFIEKNIASTLRRLKRLKGMTKKAEKDGQVRLKLSKYQSEVVEVFAD